MTVLIVSIVAGWIIFSTLLVTVICINSSRLSQIDDPFKDPVQVAEERKQQLEELAHNLMQ